MQQPIRTPMMEGNKEEINYFVDSLSNEEFNNVYNSNQMEINHPIEEKLTEQEIEPWTPLTNISPWPCFKNSLEFNSKPQQPIEPKTLSISAKKFKQKNLTIKDYFMKIENKIDK